MKRFFAPTSFFFALIGLASASASLYVHEQLLRDNAFSSPCDINSTISCSHAYLSKYGSVSGVPVALAGVVWFVFVLLLVLAAWRNTRLRETAPAYLALTSSLGMVAVGYFVYAAFVVLQTMCLFCMGTWLATLGLFLAALATPKPPIAAWPRLLADDLRWLAKTRVALAVSILFVAISVGSAVWLRAGNPPAGARAASAAPAVQATSDQRSEFQRWFAAQPRYPVPVSPDGAGVLIVKFTDYQCPACGATYYEYAPIIAKYEAQFPGAVRLVSKQFPWNTACNPNAGRTLHPFACEAAVASVLTPPQWRADMEDWLYTNGQDLTAMSVREAATRIGHIPDIGAAQGKALETIRSDAETARLLGINSTPTFFINGVKIVDHRTMPAAVLDAVIGDELRRAGKIK